jgi:CO/xanthine dehydrogenase FAD-binding subunit
MEYFNPRTLNEALGLLGGKRATILAGGTDVYPSLAGRDLPACVIDISAIGELRGIAKTDTGLRIGALTRWSDIRKADLPPAFDGLRRAAGQVGGIQIQNAGTIAGNLCNASPAADGAPPLLTLEAEVELTSQHDQRRLPLPDFLEGPRTTARTADEVLTAIHIPAPPSAARGTFEKLGARSYLVISIAMVAALVTRDAAGRIAEARIAVGACSPVAKRLAALEASLVGQDPEAPEIDPRTLAPLAPIDDPRGTASYRQNAVAELCRRAIRTAGGDNG